MLTGQSGCGKTHLCTAVYTALAKQGHSVQEIPELDEALGGRIAERCGVYNVHLEGKEKNRRVKT